MYRYLLFPIFLAGLLVLEPVVGQQVEPLILVGMAHLDVAIVAKKALMEMFVPIYGELKRERLLQLFADDWQQRLLPGPLQHVGTPEGARNYVQRVWKFYEGAIDASDLTKNAPVDDQASTIG